MENPLKLFDRDVLQDIERSALYHRDGVSNEHWARAYADLAYAASVLDAMVARSAIQSEYTGPATGVQQPDGATAAGG